MFLSLITCCFRGFQRRWAFPELSDDVLLTREKDLIARWTPALEVEARREGWTMVRVYNTPLLALHVLDDKYVGQPEQYVRMHGHAGSRAAWIAHEIHWQLSAARRLAMQKRLRKLAEPDQALRYYAEWLGKHRTIYEAKRDGIRIVADDEVRRMLAACSDKGAVASVLMGSSDLHADLHSKPRLH